MVSVLEFHRFFSQRRMGYFKRTCQVSCVKKISWTHDSQMTKQRHVFLCFVHFFILTDLAKDYNSWSRSVLTVLILTNVWMENKTDAHLLTGRPSLSDKLIILGGNKVTHISLSIYLHWFHI